MWVFLYRGYHFVPANFNILYRPIQCRGRSGFKTFASRSISDQTWRSLAPCSTLTSVLSTSGALDHSARFAIQVESDDK